MALTDATHRALRSGKKRGPPATDTALPVDFLPHMPRTGGTTIAAHLKAHLGDRICAAVRPTRWRCSAGAAVRLDDAPDFRHVRAVTGHYLGRSLEQRFPGREIRRTLLLRDPIGFHVSNYNYLMMFSLSRGGPTCDFERHLHIQPRDLAPLLLLWHWLEMPLRTILATGDARKYALLNESLAGFWFVGSYEDGDRLLAAVAADLGIPTRAARKNTISEWRNRAAWRPLRDDDLSAATAPGDPGEEPDPRCTVARLARRRVWCCSAYGPSRLVPASQFPVKPGEGQVGVGVMRRRTRPSGSGALGAG